MISYWHSPLTPFPLGGDEGKGGVLRKFQIGLVRVNMRFGFHISIAGGFSKVVERAEVRGCETIQFFSRNPRGWKYSPLDLEEVERFRSSIQSSKVSPLFLHLPYLPNIASRNQNFMTAPSIPSSQTWRGQNS